MRKQILFLVLSALPSVALAQCGTERVEVKTMHDDGVANIVLAEVMSTIEELNHLPIPEGLGPKVETRFPAESRLYTARGYLVGYKIELGSKKEPGDRDFHIVTQDLKTNARMINEMPHPDCVPNEFKEQAQAMRDRWVARFGTPPGKFKNVLQHKIIVEFTGVGFFDVKHNNDRKCDAGEQPIPPAKKCKGQEGHALNDFEGHPVIAWKEVQ